MVAIAAVIVEEEKASIIPIGASKIKPMEIQKVQGLESKMGVRKGSSSDSNGEEEKKQSP